MDLKKIWSENVGWIIWLRIGPVAGSCEHVNPCCSM